MTGPFLSPAEIAELRPAQPLGEGASAEVFTVQGRDDVVLKIARPGAEDVLAREARTMALCGGSFAPRLVGVGCPDKRDSLSLLLERAVGRPLASLLRDSDVDRAELARLVLVAGATALTRLHAWGLCHGDIKPENLFVVWDESPRLQLIDFGLSSDASQVGGGTPRYLPPEVLQGTAVRPTIADTFALAMTVSEVLLPDRWKKNEEPAALAKALPSPFDRLLSPILRTSANLAPGVSWLLEECRDLDGFAGFSPPPSEVIRREYLATRIAELDEVALIDWRFPEGRAGHWLQEVARGFDALRSLQGAGRTDFKQSGSVDLSLEDRRRFLGRLIGPWATSWSLPVTTDEVLVNVLETLSINGSPRSITYSQLSEGLLKRDASTASADEFPGDPLSWALQLGTIPFRRDLLTAIDAEADAPELVRIQGARAACYAGELRLGLRLLDGLISPAALLVQARVLHRLGDSERSQQIFEEVARNEEALLEERSQAVAHLARVALDGGHVDQAQAVLDEAAPSAAREEVQAILLLAQGQEDRAFEAVARGEAQVSDSEANARLEGVRGVSFHQRGDSKQAMRAFSRACELSSLAGAALEEATYATGLAAAATDAGNLRVALEASRRAEELFESLGHSPQTARALLARGAVLSLLGVTHELELVVRRGRWLCAQTGDRLCEGYFEFCVVDGAFDAGRRKVAADRAFQLLQDAQQDHRLRAHARLVETGGAVDSEAEAWAQQCKNRQARLDWYRARAVALEKVSLHATGDATRQSAIQVIQAMLDVAASGPLFLAAGPAFVAGAHLSLRIGLADEASRLFAYARTVAAQLLEEVPDQYRSSAESLLWVQQAQGSRVNNDSGHAQLSDVESLLRALSQRRGFRGLLDHILDLLLMWTGVQRGLLLLRAPGGKLVVRAGRNLDKNDLSPQQRELSYSMAERALSEGRPVVAVDAVNDVSAIHRSVHALNLRSVLAVPLSARGEVLGVAYLDDRVRRGAFGERELSWVGLISTVAALAIADERDRLQLERSLRRTKRAQRKLSGELSHREAQLELAERELSRMKGDRKLRGDYSQIIGRSHAMNSLLELVDRVAQSDVPALIQGESGTGKELIARAIASAGPRQELPFIAENCSAVPEALLESTLFGHQKGAFTGATRNQAGLFELAHRGTLFLDEIGDMSLSMQTKLLRVLQEGEVRSLGSERTRRVDVRVIVATHKDLKSLVAEGQFREDLYYRLNVVTLSLPPLRERQEDIPPLVTHFLNKYSPNEPRELSQAALHRLTNFSWPGNVRQLENEVRRMLVLGGTELTAADLSPEVLSDSSDVPEATTLREKVDALERRLLVEALEQARGNRTRAAEALGLSRFGLQKMAQRLEIQLPKNPPKAGRIKARGLDDSQ